MNDPFLLRRRVRVILSALPPGKHSGKSEQFIFDMLDTPDFPDLKVNEVRDAINWNHTSGFIEYRRNRDRGLDEWFLTDEGRHKEGLA